MESMSVIKAFSNLKNANWELKKTTTNKGTSINRIGEPLENFILNLFDEKDISYIGNTNNPPDIILKKAEAIEVKKLTPTAREIPLNSSFPKSKLYAKDKMITKACRNCENWKEKEMVYIVGGITNNKLKNIWFVYGNCFAANNEVYEKVKIKLQNSIKNIEGLEWSETKELGRVNRIDPLGITYLRVRGMWAILHPQKVFSNFLDESNAYMILREDKFNRIKKQKDAIKLLKGLKVENVEIADPDNPAKKLKAVLIKMKV